MERPCQVQLHPVNTKFHMETFQSVFGQYSPAVIFICKIKIITMHVNAYPECKKKWTREFSKEHGYVMEYKALLISIGISIR